MGNFKYYFILIMLSFFIFIVTGRETIFTYQTEKMYQTYYKTKTARTFVDCVNTCSLEDECVAVNHNTDTRVCQLIDIQNVNEQQTVGDDNWKTAIRSIYLFV